MDTRPNDPRAAIRKLNIAGSGADPNPSCQRPVTGDGGGLGTRA